MCLSCGLPQKAQADENYAAPRKLPIITAFLLLCVYDDFQEGMQVAPGKSPTLPMADP